MISKPWMRRRTAFGRSLLREKLEIGDRKWSIRRQLALLKKEQPDWSGGRERGVSGRSKVQRDHLHQRQDYVFVLMLPLAQLPGISVLCWSWLHWWGCAADNLHVSTLYNEVPWKVLDAPQGLPCDIAWWQWALVASVGDLNMRRRH